MRRIASNAAACAIAAFVSGCSSPASHMYTLTHTPATVAGQTPLNVSVVVGPVSVQILSIRQAHRGRSIQIPVAGDFRVQRVPEHALHRCRDTSARHAQSRIPRLAGKRRRGCSS
jgi:hypothetical protein